MSQELVNEKDKEAVMAVLLGKRIIGVDCEQDLYGDWHPWRLTLDDGAVVAFQSDINGTRWTEYEREEKKE